MDNQLNTLSLAHAVVGGFYFVFALLLLISSVAFGFVFPGNIDEPITGVFRFVCITTLIMSISGFVYAVLLKVSSRNIGLGKNRNFIIATALFGLSQIPVGFVLSAITLVALSKAETRSLFDK
ncbi:MAG: hypothetical protein K2X81_05555 [Candidatus Obscuribacterales bacterium]|nr:hypothetical protein [Candidatus Obscuribacterales bacterium]